MQTVSRLTAKGQPYKLCSCHAYKVEGHAWYKAQQGYIVATNSRKMYRIHRLIMDARQGEVVDHINGDMTDNRCSNLRIATQSQNLANSKLRANNTSGYKGVSRYRNSWCAEVKFGDVRQRKSFKTAKEAALAYNRMASKLFGEFARLNKVEV